MPTSYVRCSRLRLWVGYFICFKFTPVFFYLMFLMNVICSNKGISKSISKGMSNIYLKVTIQKNWRSQNFDFLSLKNLFPDQILGSSKSRRDIIEFKSSCCNLKIRGLGAKTCVAFLLFNLERNYGVSKSKCSCILLNKNINFNKNNKESKMKNPTYSFRETNAVLQLI